MPIDRFQVLRNTATYDAYTAYLRRARAAGRPFSLAGVALQLIALVPAAVFLSRPHAPIQLLTLMSASMILSGLCSVVATVLTRRYQRAHPYRPEPPPRRRSDD